jgi:MFS family permease
VDRFNRFSKKITPLTSLRIRDYRLFLTGFFFSQVGDQMFTIAVAWQLYQLTHSPIALGIVGIVSFLPMALLAIFGGVTADKVERKKLLIITQMLLGFCAALLATATYFKFIDPIFIYITVFMSFSVRAFYAPVRQSIIPSLVPREDLLNAISLNTLARQSAIVIGPALAGFLIALYGVNSIYFIAAFLFIFMTLTIFPIKVPPIREKASFNWKSIKEGVVFVKSSKIISSTILLDFFATFFASATSLLPIFAVDVLHSNAQGLGLLYAATSAGAILAGIVLSSIKDLKHQGMVIIISVLIYAFATIGFGLSRSLYLSMTFLALIGAGDMISTIVRNTIRQAITPDHIRGRMIGINILFAQGGPKLGDAEAGFLAGALGAPASVVIGGIGTLIATGLIVYTHPVLKKYKGVKLEV